jgi:hypothetical protein
VNRTALIEQLKDTQRALERLLVLLESAERDRFVSHLYQSRREYRLVCERAGKSGKQIERSVLSSYQVAESIGFKGEFRQWEHLLRIGE